MPTETKALTQPDRYSQSYGQALAVALPFG